MFRTSALPFSPLTDRALAQVALDAVFIDGVQRAGGATTTHHHDLQEALIQRVTGERHPGYVVGCHHIEGLEDVQ